jgi:hypothetical protein
LIVAGHVECVLGSDGKQERTDLIYGWKKAEAHVREAVALEAAVQIRPRDVMAEVATDTGRAEGGFRSGRRWTAYLRRQDLLARAVDQMIIAQRSYEIRPKLVTRPGKLGDLALCRVFA